jgi:predicted RNA-binding Zn-ribbon protein involved in translation (DUF1610 family)
MTFDHGKPVWAPKVSKAKIQRLYLTDAQGMVDEELIDEVGWALWSRCDSILIVTAAHYGRVACPTCGSIIERQAPRGDDDRIQCPACDWQISWKIYHQTYQGKQLFGANAVDIFKSYHQAFPQTHDANAKMLLIDQLIHAFHTGLNEPGRPVGANLIEGSLKEVILFLDTLTNGGSSAAGIGDSRKAWRHTLANLSWAPLFIKIDPDLDEDPEI